MKKAIYILSALLLGLVSCNKTEFESIKPKEVDPTGLVAVTMKVQIPQVELFAQTKADGQRSHLPDIQDMRVAVFGTSGYPQAYAKAEPIVSATDESAGSYASTNHVTGTDSDIYYFKVLLPVYEGEAHVHIIANGPKTIKFVDEDEDSIMKQMRSEEGVGAFWARVIMPDGILTQLDQNGIMQTDDEGNFIPSEGTAHLFEDLVLVRNFAEVKLINEATNIRNISWTLVNVPKSGSVAPMADDTFVDDYKNYDFDLATWRMVKGAEEYDGFMFPDADELDETRPVNDPEDANDDLKNKIGDSDFVYERPLPTDKATCILMRAQFNNGQAWDTYYTYYRMDLTEESVGGYFPIYRNYMYQMKIHKVGNRGSKTIADAMNRDSGGNVSQSTEAKKLTDISDGESRLFVEYVEKSFTEGGKKGLWVQYVPNVNKDEDGDGYADVDNTNITVTVKTQGDALVDGTPATLTPTGASSVDGYYFYEFNLNEQNESKDLVSVLQVKATNGVEGDENSTLYRDITLRVLKKMDMTLSLVPKQVAGQGTATVLNITLPTGLPESMFPMEFKIEDINHTLYSTGKDGNNNDIIVPVKSDKSIVDGTTNSFYFIRTVASYAEYQANNVISTQFKTNKDASATTIYVANEYFKTQSINLLNNGMYVNPVKATVPFNTTSVVVEVEFAEPTGKTWTVAGTNPVTITDVDGATITGGTGNGKFVMHFPVNNSTTASMTRTASVTYNGSSQTVTITQEPLEFSITPATQTVIASATTATVTVHAEEGMAWTASIAGPTGVTGYSLSATEGTGTQTLTVTLPANTATSARNFTVTARMTAPAATATATITQRRAPNTYTDFAYNAFGNFSGSASATSTDGYVTIDLENCYRYYDSYIRTSNNGQYGVINITPLPGMRITTVVITYANNYVDTNPSVSVGTRTVSGNTVTWTVNSSNTVTYTSSNNGNTYGRRMTNIRVNYVPVQ